MTQYNYQTTRRLRKAQARAALKEMSLTEAEIDEAVDSMEGTVTKETRHGTDAAANTNTTAAHFWRNKTGRAYQVKQVSILPDSTLTAHSSNYATITVEKENGAAGGKATVAELATTTDNFAAGVADELTLSSTAANLIVDDEAVLSYKIVKAGTGVAVPASLIEVEMIPYSD
jgi:hypothetical protein